MSDINLCNIHKWQGYGNCPDCPEPDEDLGNRLQEAHYEIERLEDRLEVYDSTGKIRLSEDWDGIACRDETIKMLDEQRKRQSAEIEQLTDDASSWHSKYLRQSAENKVAFEAGYQFGRADAWHNYPPRAKGAYNEWRKERVSTEQTSVCPETAIEQDCTHRHITTGDVRKSLECTHPERTIAGGWTQCDVCGDKWQ